MSNEVRAGFIAGAAQIVAAAVALVGVLTTAPSKTEPTRSVNAQSPASFSSCSDVFEHYRRIVRLDLRTLEALVATGSDGVAPIEADPEARRCGVNEAALRAVR
ncbi:hypothetical protein M1L60_31415 [Actinoplanes sp. TRM 88003]|uniref:Uncharacterized protein n=1 Tax=Paractinoplanes aksuensis TaxID=2939490 RepID=A0ABT1DX12_9ACTN|nr:hypothetical protein [Actinoplanes aksuensis]MCO8275098.1 hypothetical protein [Actinoplanes aksuensis]